MKKSTWLYFLISLGLNIPIGFLLFNRHIVICFLIQLFVCWFVNNRLKKLERIKKEVEREIGVKDIPLERKILLLRSTFISSTMTPGCIKNDEITTYELDWYSTTISEIISNYPNGHPYSITTELKNLLTKLEGELAQIKREEKLNELGICN